MRLIDADRLTRRFKARGCFKKDMLGCMVAKIINTEPTIDAVPVVRCKDCKHRRDDKDYVSGHYCVMRPSNGGRFCEDNDFCSYGERKEN